MQLLHLIPIGFATKVLAAEFLVPLIVREWTTLARNPDLDSIESPTRQPADFAI